VESKRGDIYATLCKFGTHADFKANALITPVGGLKVGPFLNMKIQSTILLDGATHLPPAVSLLTGLLAKLDHQQDRKIYARYHLTLNLWWQKYKSGPLITMRTSCKSSSERPSGVHSRARRARG